MKKKRAHSKESTKIKEQRKSVNTLFSPSKSTENFLKDKQMRTSIKGNMKGLLKPKREKSANQRNSFGVLNHSNSMADHFRGSYIKGRYLTETMPSKATQKENIGQVKKASIFGKKNRNHLESSASFGKDRFSFNQTFGQQKSADKQKNVFQNQSKFSSKALKELQKQRKQIQRQVEKSILRPTIHKKQLLKITNHYERLLDKVVNSASRNTAQGGDCDRYLAGELELQRAESTCTVRRHELAQCSGGSGEKKMMLKLEDLRQLGIMDYDDEFMSHYEELSQSWKRDLKVQKRY